MDTMPRRYMASPASRRRQKPFYPCDTDGLRSISIFGYPASAWHIFCSAPLELVQGGDSGMNLRALLIVVAGLALWRLERRCPLRRTTESAGTRNFKNLTIAAVSAVSLQVIAHPLIQPLARWVDLKRVGLAYQLPLPERLRTLVVFLLLDYTLYVWHILTHRVPFLWRMHIVHHIDRDLSLTTGLRFHATELVTSLLWRALQILVIGVSPTRLTSWQTLTLLSVLFHHSNIRLPIWVERRLLWIVVTPRMHGIHHSTRRKETDSNWSSGLTCWDWLHGTLVLDVPQEALTIGVPAYRSRRDVTLLAQLALPFIRQRPSWLDEDGSKPIARETLVQT